MKTKPKRMRDEGGKAGFGLYIHWPFCRAKCPYCDFNSHVGIGADDDRFIDALLREMDHAAAEIGQRRLNSIFFGGGTPSLMPPSGVARLIERAGQYFEIGPSTEITLEANPTSAERTRLEAFKAAGINRLSLGVQALDDEALRFLGREHGADEALRTLEHGAHLFPRISFDLIYGRPGQTLDNWRKELARALDHAGGHLSVYQLTIEPGTRFQRLHDAGKLVMPDDDLQADFFDLTGAMLEQAGLHPYEISSHARPGEACRHNLVYWRAGDYLGIGPGAHGRLTLGAARLATRTENMPRAWLQRVESQGHGEISRERLELDDRVVEMVLMGLRLREGIDLSRLERLADMPPGTSLTDCLAACLNGQALSTFIEDAFITIESGYLKTTAAGRSRTNAIVAALLDRPALPASMKTAITL